MRKASQISPPTACEIALARVRAAAEEVSPSVCDALHTPWKRWNAKAVTAKTAYLFTQGLVIPKGSLLRVTSSDASGYFHVHGVYVNVTG